MASELSGRPLRDTRRDRALFVDREQPLQAAEKTLRNGGNVLLVGSRGSGKSSLIKCDQNVQQRISNLSEPARRLLAEVEANGAASPSDQALLTTLGWTRSRA